MNAQIRAVRAAERQLRGLPPAAAAILDAEGVPARFEPALGWAEAAPLGALAGAVASGAAREAAAAARPRSRPPEPPRGGTEEDGGGAAVAAGALTGVRRAVEGIGDLVARASAAGRDSEPARPVGAGRAAEGIGAALAGRTGPTLAEALAGGSRSRGGAEAQPVFSLGAIGRRATAALAPEAAARTRGGAPEASEGRALAAALAGGAPAPSAVVAAVGRGVGVAALQAAGAAATVVEALVPAMDGISRRIDAAAARAAEVRDAAVDGAATVPASGSGRSPLAGIAAAATRAFADPAPAELASTRPPTLEGQVEPASTPVPAAAGASGAAPQVIDAEWVVAVVGDALLEQARRQGIDLT